LSLGNLYLAARDFSKAEEEAAYAIQRNPGSAPAHELKGIALLMSNQTEGALAELSRVVELDPGSASGYINLGLLEAGLGRNDDAERHFRRAIAVAPHMPQAYINLANFYRMRRQQTQAEEVLREGVAQSPTAISLYVGLADLLYTGQKQDAAREVISSLWTKPLKPSQAALAAGDFYFAHHDIQQALTEYRRGLAADAKSIEIRNHMVECYLGSGQIRAAEALNQEVLHQRPRDVYAGIAKARILLLSGKHDDSIAEFRRLLTQSQDLPQVHYYLAQAYRQNQNLQEAKAELLDTLKMAPSMASARNSLTEVFLALGDLGSAKLLAEEALRKTPADAAARTLLGTVYLQQGDLPKAREQFLMVCQIAPTPLSNVNLARVYVAGRQWAEAEKALERALQLDPHSDQALDGLVSLWMKQNKSTQALCRAEEFVAAFPKDAGGHLILGSLQADLKNYGTAQDQLAQAIQLDSTLLMARIRLADIYQQQGNLPASIRTYEEILQIQPRSPAIHTVLGDLYLRQQNPKMAQAHYEQALAVDPGFALAANNLAWLQVENGGNLDVALGLAQRAKQLQPDLINSTDTLGWIEYKKGLYSDAVHLLRECVAKAPDTATYRFHLGMALLAAGDRRQGKAELSAALHLNLPPKDVVQVHQILGQNN